MQNITLLDHSLQFCINYQKKRKTIRIKLLNKNQLEITAPLRYPKANIVKLLQTKQNWILTQIERLNAIEDNPVNKSVKDGSPILFLGKSHILSISYGPVNKPELIQHEAHILMHLPSKMSLETNNLEPVLKQWYIEIARGVLTKKTMFWADKIGVSPQKVRIKEQKTRWGSCSTKGNINYNWRIIMAPSMVIDYLIIHELCHLLVPNHSHEFWNQVEKFLPDYKRHRNWLRMNDRLLTGIL